MGRVTIKVEGSFPIPIDTIESAEVGGHAAALGRAIERLAALLPEAIKLDHKLHDEGERPPEADFGARWKP